MAKVFELLADLPIETQQEVERIQANDEIVLAIGETLPTDYEGFAKPSLFLKSDAADGTKGMYENVGTNTDASWNLIGEISTAEIGDGQVTAAKLAPMLDLTSVAISNLKVETGTPVNAVAASQTLTLTGAIVPGVHAESVITSDTTNVSDAETVTIGSTVYRFKDTLAQAFDVKIGASAAATLDNLKAAINASGTPGTEYFTGTTAHPTVNATTNTNTEQTVVADTAGTAGNSLATTETLTNGAWGAATLAGGINGTVGGAKKLLADSSYLYIAIAANTVADANWRRMSLGSAF
jgi:hypothetical protein